MGIPSLKEDSTGEQSKYYSENLAECFRYLNVFSLYG